MNTKFFQANELSDLVMESEFCLGLVDDHCDTQKSISSFVSSKLIMIMTFLFWVLLPGYL